MEIINKCFIFTPNISIMLLILFHIFTQWNSPFGALERFWWHTNFVMTQLNKQSYNQNTPWDLTTVFTSHWSSSVSVCCDTLNIRKSHHFIRPLYDSDYKTYYNKVYRLRNWPTRWHREKRDERRESVHSFIMLLTSVELMFTLEDGS